MTSDNWQVCHNVLKKLFTCSIKRYEQGGAQSLGPDYCVLKWSRWFPGFAIFLLSVRNPPCLSLKQGLRNVHFYSWYVWMKGLVFWLRRFHKSLRYTVPLKSSQMCTSVNTYTHDAFAFEMSLVKAHFHSPKYMGAWARDTQNTKTSLSKWPNYFSVHIFG